MKMKTVDLNKARTNKDAKVFAGRERGKHWRSEFRLDELDSANDSVRVVIPADVIAVNISFFLSMFGKSVRSLGKEGFREHYEFECNEDLLPLIRLGIDQAVKTSSALPD
jgi:hypothetical protein